MEKIYIYSNKGFVKNKIAGGNPPNFKSVYIKIDIWDFLFKSKVGFNFLWFSFQAFPYAEVFINAIIVRFYNFKLIFKFYYCASAEFKILWMISFPIYFRFLYKYNLVWSY